MNEVIQRFEEMKQDHMKEQSAWIEYLSDELKKERRKNKCYKQELELILKDTFYESEHEWVSPIHVIRKKGGKSTQKGG